MRNINCGMVTIVIGEFGRLWNKNEQIKLWKSQYLPRKSEEIAKIVSKELVCGTEIKTDTYRIVSKYKVVLVHVIKEYGGAGLQIHEFLTQILNADKRAPSRLGHFTSTERVHGTHWIGGWLRHKTRMGVSGNRRNLLLVPEIVPTFIGRPDSSLVTAPTELSRPLKHTSH
jgi:hypothetical protein